MSMTQLRAEDRLAGASNWSPWKTRIVFVLEDLELYDIVQGPMVLPHVTTPLLVAEFKKRNTEAKRTISDAVRDHAIHHLIGKEFAFEMWDSLCKLYQSPNQKQKMVLHEKLRSIKMLKSASMTSYLGRFTQTQDELAAIGEIVDPMVLVRTTLNSFSKPWGSFVRGVVARKAMPSWERLWDDFV
jgi:hypothetical protein